MDDPKKRGNYILEVSWGCPSDRYPLNGLFQFDQCAALNRQGKKTVFLALDMRSFKRWRRWGIVFSVKDQIPVYEYNFPYGPMSPRIKYRIQDRCFVRSMDRICREQGMPKCVHFHGVMEAISGMKWCVEHDVPTVITEHITPVKEGAEVHKRMRDAYAQADAIICVSSRLASDIEKAYGAHTNAVIPNIVDLSVFKLRSSADVPGDASDDAKPQDDVSSAKEYRFISAARLDPGKGFDTLLRAFSMLLRENPGQTGGQPLGQTLGHDTGSGLSEASTGRNIHLTIMGDGEEMTALKSECVSLGINDNVTFTGAYARKEFADELLRSDCFVLASRSETFGIVYAEAMAAGVPVISTRCGGPEDFIDENNGILVPVGDADALKEAMKKMASGLAGYDAKNISEACKARFSPENVAKQIINVINGCVR